MHVRPWVFVRMARMAALSIRIIAMSAGRPEKAEDIHAEALVHKPSAPFFFRYFDATLHVRDFRCSAAVAETVVRCM